MKAIPYRELIGKLLYFAIATRPDIVYRVGILCRFVENPGPSHWHAAKRVLRYLGPLLWTWESSRLGSVLGKIKIWVFQHLTNGQ
jgi:hypothetical protein